MKSKLLFPLALTGLLAAADARAQTNITPALAAPKTETRVLVPERPTATDANVGSTSDLRPNRPERPDLPPDVKSRIELFRRDARKFLEEQQALKRKLQGANDEEREAIRQRLKALREQMLERQRELRKEFRDRQRELREKLVEHREVLESTTATDSPGHPRDR